MEDKILKLTNTVYKILEFFPESDPLKNRAKDKALVIMSAMGGSASGGENSIQEDIDILLGYLWIGKTQGWLNSANCLIITGEYEKIKKELAPAIKLPQRLPNTEELLAEEEYVQTEFKASGDYMSEEAEDEEEEISDSFEELAVEEIEEVEPVAFSSRKNQVIHELSARQKKIIDFLISNERAQVMDLKKILPDITKRTIRRDLDELMELRKVVRFGDFNQVFYQIKHLG